MLLSIPDRTARTYLAFASIVNKDAYQKNNIGMNYAGPISSIKGLAKRIYREVIDEDFSREVEKKLEKALIDRIVSGDVQKPQDLVKLKDAFAKDPKSIKEFIDTQIGVYTLFTKTKARGAYHLRNIINSATYVSGHAARYLENPDVKPTKEQLDKLRLTRKFIDDILKKVDD